MQYLYLIPILSAPNSFKLSGSRILQYHTKNYQTKNSKMYCTVLHVESNAGEISEIINNPENHYICKVQGIFCKYEFQLRLECSSIFCEKKDHMMREIPDSLGFTK